MRKNTASLSLLTLLVALAATGCASTVRSVSNGLWRDSNGDHKLYLSYWEGTCRKGPKPIGGCSTGESHVKFCDVNKDNTMKCEALPELDALLNQ